MKDISLEIKGLNIKFGKKVAVDNISFSVKPGQIYALIGPNGAGKTTTIKAITGLIISEIGSVKICGNKKIEESRKNMAYIPDEPFVYQYLSGREFLRYVGSIYELDKNLIEEKIKTFVSKFNIEDEIDELFESFSRGTKQKIMIIAAFMRDPKLLIIDEPIVGLDVSSQKIVKKMFRDFANNGGSILLCTHTLNIAEEIADKIGIIKNGKIISELSKDINDLENKYLALIND